ncbi:MAG TPA: CsgG/HfaB family protein, partial [Humisphaera sp.]
ADRQPAPTPGTGPDAGPTVIGPGAGGPAAGAGKLPPAAVKAWPAGATVTVAILDFEAGGKAHAELGRQIPDALAAMLSDEPGIKLVERADLDRAIREQANNLTGLVDADRAVKVGKIVGAQVLITGKVFPLDKDTYVTAKLIGTETSAVKAVMARAKADRDVGDLLVMLSQRIGTTLRTQGQELLPDGGPVDPIPGLKKALAGKRKPTVSVTIAERHQAARQPVDPAAETEVRRALIECGFTVLDGPAAARGQKPDLVVAGEGFSEFAATIGNLTVCSARVELKVTDPKTNVLKTTDRTTARAAELSEAVAGKAALQRAGRDLAVRLLAHLAATLPDDPAKPAAR